MRKKRKRRPSSGTPLQPETGGPDAIPARILQGGLGSEDLLSLSVLAIVGLTALLLRVVRLSRPMDYDESFTFVYYASRPLGESLSNYSLPNNHLFHTLLVHISVGLLGNHPWVVRLPAFCAGLALVPATYCLVRRLFDRWTALAAAAFVGPPSRSWATRPTRAATRFSASASFSPSCSPCASSGTTG